MLETSLHHVSKKGKNKNKNISLVVSVEVLIENITTIILYNEIKTLLVMPVIRQSIITLKLQLALECLLESLSC